MTAEARITRNNSGTASRLRSHIRGAVQGVGFRPFVYRLAGELGLTGWIVNSSQGVTIELEGPLAKLHDLLSRLRDELPPNASIHSLDTAYLDPVGYTGFEIRESDARGPRSAVVLPDIAICADCRREIFDGADRRFGYPFTNCTNCGPRFSIIEALPYDRPNTSMKKFEMCGECTAEYIDPENRRFHAQPNACPKCGPKVTFADSAGRSLADSGEAINAAADALREGKIVAVKGLGGFHLMADAGNASVVRELRHRKHREEKPLAVMVADPRQANEICEISQIEMAALTSPEAPIVILRHRLDNGDISELVAPGNPNLGLMLAYTPLHLLLLKECGIPLVATSGNLSDEPICTDPQEAFVRLKGIADKFLVHNRPIVRPVDDSVVRVIAGQVTVLRRARGYAPLPVLLDTELPSAIALGAHLKSAVAASSGSTGAVVSQHIGDLDTDAAREAFTAAVKDITELYGIEPEESVCDLHPDYFSTSFAGSFGLPVQEFQHHHAHILSCIAENEIEGPVFGIAWDGTGYGTDGTVWGGEFLTVEGGEFERTAHLRQFRLPGGEKAVREPRRSALGLMYELFGEEGFDHQETGTLRAFSTDELDSLARMLAKGLNSPLTSSAGRLFDAAASLAGVRQFIRFEGQAAMELEFLTEGFLTNEAYDDGVPDTPLTPAVIDWEPMIRSVIRDVQAGAPTGLISARFHNTLAEMMVGAAKLAGLEKVALSGGCFQNRYLTERAAERLGAEGFRVYRHQRIPPNDGGIALGQLYGAAIRWSGDGI